MGRLLVEGLEELLDCGGCERGARLAVDILEQVDARRLGQRRKLLHLVDGGAARSRGGVVRSM
jgi:hypothetical protein